MKQPNLLTLQLQFQNQRSPYVLATVVEIIGSSSAKPSAKAIFGEKGELIAGWVGGGCAQALAASAAMNCISTGEPDIVNIDLDDEIFGAGMPCGGKMRIYLEPHLPKPVIWLMGHGLIAETICDFATQIGFDVIVNDSQANANRFPNALKIYNNIDGQYLDLSPNTGDFVIVATHHKGDYFSLSRALNSEAGYIALIASRQRAQLITDRFRQEGVMEDSLKRIRSPAGLNLGAKTPAEIALSIVSEMVLVRRGGTGIPLFQSSFNDKTEKNDLTKQ